MSLAGWALLVSFISLVVAGGSLYWQISSWRRARTMQLDVRFGALPPWGEGADWFGIEVVNHSDFPVRVQDVQMIFSFGDGPQDEPLIVGIARDRGTIPGTVQPHDSGFVAAGLPRVPDDEAPGVVYANAITAVGNVRSQAYELQHVPPFPASMRFNDMFPGGTDAPEI